MRILILGSGGREHALAWKIAQSPHCDKLFCSPGNAGIATVAECLSIESKPPFGALIDWCGRHRIDLVVVGPEDPLAQGVVDALAASGIDAFGPTADGARIEASKTFAKEIMSAAGIPTGAAETFTNAEAAVRYLEAVQPPYVIKADGLAAGKGVTVAATIEEATRAVREALDENRFGEAGSSILIEEYLDGVEASLLAFVDGETILPMDTAQDHKPVFDGDRGPNTGGMGALSPAPVFTHEIKERAIKEILEPAVAELRRRGIVYRGVLYCGLMITDAGPKVVEYNCRLGDPETQVVLPLLQSDALELFYRSATGTLSDYDLRIGPGAAACVVMASDGYPAKYETGRVISGIEVAQNQVQTTVFYAGVRSEGDELFTSGGR
ncbi:phosphoribosylamine--glycine ligase, partial [Candidatus Sumerlaeota bacterium]|nr:phosphoribosylamine--glycine ligase [Candidatus Sumerlaeota bacterium]